MNIENDLLKRRFFELWFNAKYADIGGKHKKVEKRPEKIKKIKK